MEIGLDGHRALLAHLHDRALAELLLDLAEGHLECLVSLHVRAPSFVPAAARPGGGSGELRACAAAIRCMAPPYGGGVTANGGGRVDRVRPGSASRRLGERQQRSSRTPVRSRTLGIDTAAPRTVGRSARRARASSDPVGTIGARPKPTPAAERTRLRPGRSTGLGRRSPGPLGPRPRLAPRGDARGSAPDPTVTMTIEHPDEHRSPPTSTPSARPRAAATALDPAEQCHVDPGAPAPSGPSPASTGTASDDCGTYRCVGRATSPCFDAGTKFESGTG